MTNDTTKAESQPSFAIETKSCWETYVSPEVRQDMQALAEGYVSFLTACKTERETVH